MINKVVLAGEITREIKIIRFNEKIIINLILSTFDNKKKILHRVILYDNLAKLYVNKLKKFEFIIIEGKISNRRWLDKNNRYNYITEIIAEKLSIIKNDINENLKKNNKLEIEINNNYVDEINDECYEDEFDENKNERSDGYENEL